MSKLGNAVGVGARSRSRRDRVRVTRSAGAALDRHLISRRCESTASSADLGTPVNVTESARLRQSAVVHAGLARDPLHVSSRADAQSATSIDTIAHRKARPRA